MNRGALAGVAVAIGVTGALGWARQTFGIAAVVGVSMQPTLRGGDRVLYRRTRRIARGQVVVLSTDALEQLVPAAAGSRQRSPQLMIKRVAAVAGDPWPQGVSSDGGALVPAGRLVVLGDNERSLDSRAWGAIPVEVVQAVMVRRLAGGLDRD